MFPSSRDIAFTLALDLAVTSCSPLALDPKVFFVGIIDILEQVQA